MLKVKRLNEEAQLPKRMTAFSAGLDLRLVEDVEIPARELASGNTGIAVAIPVGYVGLIRPRSGLMFKQKVVCMCGTIDADYRGEIKLLFLNLNDEKVVLRKGMRAAQLVIVPCSLLQPIEAEELPETERNDKGFGSTGYK